MKRAAPSTPSSDSPVKRIRVENGKIDALFTEGPVDIQTLDASLNGGRGYLDAHLLVVFPYRQSKGCIRLECQTASAARSLRAPVKFYIKLMGELGRQASSSLIANNVSLKIGLRGAGLVPGPPPGSQSDSTTGLFLSGSCLVFTERVSLCIDSQTRLELNIRSASNDLSEPRSKAPEDSTIPALQIFKDRLTVDPDHSQQQKRVLSPPDVSSSSPTAVSPSVRPRLDSPGSQGFTPQPPSPLFTLDKRSAVSPSRSLELSENPSPSSRGLPRQGRDQDMAKDFMDEVAVAASLSAHRDEDSSQEVVIDVVKRPEAESESVHVPPIVTNTTDCETQVNELGRSVIWDPYVPRKPQGGEEDTFMMRDDGATRDSSHTNASILSAEPGGVTAERSTMFSRRSSPSLSRLFSTTPDPGRDLDTLSVSPSTRPHRAKVIPSDIEPSLVSNVAGPPSMSGSRLFIPPICPNPASIDSISHHHSSKSALVLSSFATDASSGPIQNKSSAPPTTDIRVVSNGAMSRSVPRQSIERGTAIDLPGYGSVVLLPAGVDAASSSDEVTRAADAGGKKRKNGRVRKRNKLRGSSAAVGENSSNVSISARPSVSTDGSVGSSRSSVAPSGDTVPQSTAAEIDGPRIPTELIDYEYINKLTVSVKAGREGHIIGIVKSADPCAPARGKEANNYYRSIVLSDTTGEISLTCFVWDAEITWLPQVSIGDVLLIRQLKRSQSPGAPATGYPHKFRWAVFDAANNSYHHGLSPSPVPCAAESCSECRWQRYNPFWQPTEFELQYMRALHKWRKDSEKGEALGQVYLPTPKEQKPSLISDVTREDMEQRTPKNKAIFTDLIVEVVKHFAGPPAEILVTDYTTNPNLRESSTDHPHGQQQLKITLWDDVGEMNIQKEEIYHLRNTRIIADDRDDLRRFVGHIGNKEFRDVRKLGKIDSSHLPKTPRVLEFLKRRGDYMATVGLSVVPKEGDVKQVIGGMALQSATIPQPNKEALPEPLRSELRPIITIDTSLPIARRTTLITDIVNYPSVPATFIIKARVADHLPANYREFVALVCPVCGANVESVLDGQRVCLDCRGHDPSPPPPLLVYRFRICLQDLVGNTLPVLVGGPEAEHFLGQPPTSDASILQPALEYRMRPLAGNIVEYRQGVYNGESISRVHGPPIDFCITSFQSERTGELRYKLCGCSLEIFDPEMEAAKYF